MTTRRLNRIFQPDGRALIVAYDHAMVFGPGRGMAQPAATLGQIIAGGADAILTTYGLARRLAQELAPVGLILRLDGAGTSLGPADSTFKLFYTVEDALRVGADAVVVCAFPGTVQEETTLESLARVAAEAHRWGLPVLAEMVPGGFGGGPDSRTAEKIALAARVAAELGADWVKIPYAEGFQRVTSTCYVPAVILGGAKKGSSRHMLETIKASLEAGGAGVAVGRNIFQADDPARMTAAVASLVHGQASVEEAHRMLTER